MRLLILAFIFSSTVSATAQIPVVSTPTVWVTTISTPTIPVLTATPSNNFQTMSDLHSAALAQTAVGNENNFDHVNHSDPSYVPVTPQPTALATEVKPNKGDLFTSGKWMIEGGAGIDFLGQNYNSKTFSDGLGGYLALGHTMDTHWSLWLSEDFYDHPPTQSTYIYPGSYYSYEISDALSWETVLSIRYIFGGSFISPYLFAGPGLSFTNYYPNTALMTQAGLGFQFQVDRDVSLFVESKVNFIFNTDYFSPDLFGDIAIDVPVNAGVVIDLSDAAPEAQPTPTPEPTPTWFIKMGGGLGMEADNENYGLDAASFISSISIGTELRNNFSCFASAEQLPGAWGFFGNLQYSVPFRTHFFSPYFVGGLGLSFLNQSISTSTSNACLLLGLGMEFRLTPAVTLFTECKLFDAAVSSDYNSQEYLAFLSGLKFNMPFKSEVSPNPVLSGDSAKVFWEIAGGLDTPAQNWQAAYSTTPGEIFGLGCEFKDGFAFQLDVENYSFTGIGTAGFIMDNEIHLLPTVRYLLGTGGVRPYFLAGLGADLEFSTAYHSTVTVAYLDTAVGAGLEVPVDEGLHAFVEGKYHFVFTPGVLLQDIPVLIGVRYGL